MSRSKRSAQLETKSKRLGLVSAKEHVETVSNGCYLIYYRPKNGGAGNWLARWYNPETRKMVRQPIGATDDYKKADGVEILDYTQAEAKAKAWFKKCERKANQEEDGEEAPDGDWTVKDVFDYYFTNARKTRKKSSTADLDESKVLANTIPVLGPIKVRKLTTARIKKWHFDLADRGRIKTGWGVGHGENMEFLDPPKTDEEKRKRKVSANGELARLKAALNFAVAEKKLDPEHTPWAQVKPFPSVTASRVRFLSVEEQRRLINACTPAFREFVCGALMTGARYSELASTRVRDLNLEPGKGALHVDGKGKDSRPRWIWLTEEGEEFFRRLALGKKYSDLLFTHPESEPVKRVPPKSIVTYKGKKMIFAHREVKVLETLLGSNGKALRYDAIRESQWPKDPHSQRRVTQTLEQIRKKFAGIPATFKGGYREIIFVLEDAQALEIKEMATKVRAPFEEEDGWRVDDAKAPLRKALAKAELEPMTFHELRHSYASDLINRGVPLFVVSHQLGHADTQMVERHYGHLCKIAEQRMIREGGKNLGVIEPEVKIQSLKIRTPKPPVPDHQELIPAGENPIPKRKAFTPDAQEEIPS